MRGLRIAVVVTSSLLLAACEREPAGTPVALEAPEEQIGDQYGQWVERGEQELAGERFSEALFAFNKALEIARVCFADDKPGCAGSRGYGAPSGLGGMAGTAVWRDRLNGTYAHKADTLIKLGKYRAADRVAEEGLKIRLTRDQFVWPYVIKADALFGQGKYADALAAYRAQESSVLSLYCAARITRCLFKLQKLDEARAQLDVAQAMFNKLDGDQRQTAARPGTLLHNFAVELDAAREELKGAP